MSRAAPALTLEADSPEIEAQECRALRDGAPRPIHRIDLFLEQLRAMKLDVGAREQIRVRRLLLSLAQAGESPRSFRELGGWIAPLIATSPEQQARIHAHCLEADRALQVVDPGDADDDDHDKKRRFKNTAALAILVTSVVAFGVYFWLTLDPTPTQPKPQSTPTDTPGPLEWPELSIAWVIRVLVALIPLAFVAYGFLRKAPDQAVLRREEAQAGKASAAGGERRIQFYRGARAAFARRTSASGLGRLKIRRETASLRLDEARTVELAARSRGLVTRLVYGRRSITVSHVVLIDRAAPGDHLGALGDILVERLRQAEVPVEAWDFHNDPTRLTPVGAVLAADLRMTTLPELAARHQGDLFVIVSDGARFLHPVTREPALWIGELSAFARLALFTPVPPRDWGARERALAASGFQIFLASAEGAVEYAKDVAQWAEYPDAETAPDAVEVRARRRAVAIPERYVYGPEPARDEVERLIFELQSLLEPEAFELLCALGCAPVTDPELTLFLGSALQDRAGRPLLNEARLTELSRLAWLREGYMPLWFCEELMRRLPAQRFDEVKKAIVEFIARPVSGVPSGPELALEYDDAELAGRAEEGLKRLPKTDPRRDRLYLKFVRASDKEALDIEIRPHDPADERQRRWRRTAPELIRAGVAGVLVYALWPAVTTALSDFAASTPLLDEFSEFFDELAMSQVWTEMHAWALLAAVLLWVGAVWLQKRLRSGAIATQESAPKLATQVAWSAPALATLVFLIDAAALALAADPPPLLFAGTAAIVAVITIFHRVPEVPAELADLFRAPGPGRRVLGIFAALGALGGAAWLRGPHNSPFASLLVLALLILAALAVAGWAFRPGTAGATDQQGRASWLQTAKGLALPLLVLAGAVLIDEGLLRIMVRDLVSPLPPLNFISAAVVGLLGAWAWRVTRVHFALAIMPMVVTFLICLGARFNVGNAADSLGLQIFVVFPFMTLAALVGISVALWRANTISGGRVLASTSIALGGWMAGYFVSAVLAIFLLEIMMVPDDVFSPLILAAVFASAMSVSACYLFLRHGLKSTAGETSTVPQPSWGPAAWLFVPLFWFVSVSYFWSPTLRLDVSSLGVPMAAFVAWRFGPSGYYAVLVGGLTWLLGFSVGPTSAPGSLGTYALMIAVAHAFYDRNSLDQFLQARPVTPSLLILLALMFCFGIHWRAAGFSQSISAEPYSYYLLFILGLSGMRSGPVLGVTLTVAAAGLAANVLDAGVVRTGQVTYFSPVNSPAKLLAIPFCFWMGRGVRLGLLGERGKFSGWAFWLNQPAMLLLLAAGVAQLSMVTLQIAGAGSVRIPIGLFTYASVAVLAFAIGALHGWRGFAWAVGISVATGILGPMAIAGLELGRTAVGGGGLRFNLVSTVSLFVPLGVIGLAWVGAGVRQRVAPRPRGSSPKSSGMPPRA